MYSEEMYSKSAFAALKDSSGHAMINRTHRSPFSSASIVSMKPFHAVGPSLLNQEANFSTETAVIRSDFPNLRRDFVETIGGTETGLERVSSYATIIERYSNTVSLNVDARGWGSCMVPRRHVSTKLSNLSLMLEDAKSSEAGPKEMVECSKKSISDGLTEAGADSALEKREVGQGGYIIKDAERITAIKDDIDAKLHPLEEQADWVDRVISAHKKSIKDRKLAYTGGKTPEVANENLAYETPAGSELKEERPPTEMSGNKPSNPISEYIRRGPVNSNTQRGAGQATSQGSTQSSATVSNPVREPQIELRMTPSHNESVVAINVDELSARTAGAKDQLSVVISSKKNASNAPNADNRSDFGSMQISISEDTVPVKQIEFSINGKPVSELKSIVARADKLDVLGSMDKVEIRIPSKDNHARTASQHTQQVVAATPNPSAVLNLHINAKFNGPRVQQPKDVKPESAPPVVRSSPPSQPPVPPKSHNIFSSIKQENAKPDGTVTTNLERPEAQFKDPVVNTDVLATTTKKMSSNVAENVDKGLNRTVNSGTNQLPRSSPQDPTKIKNPKQDSSVENRVPSNIIPWWSSEDAFKKIKKKGSDAAEGSSVEAAPNKIEDVVAEPKKPEAALKTKSTSQPESAVPSNPVDSPKTIAPGKDANKSEVAEKTSELLDLSTVRVTSSQRYVHGKAPKFVKQKSRMTKKVYRARNVVKTSGISKQSSDTQINSVPPPKVVKFVAVNPRKVEVNRRPEATGTDEKQRTKVEEESKKLEGDATRVGHENVQKNSDTVIKGADLERSVNRSAGVSANSASAAGESGSEPAKAKARENMSGTVEKGPPSERVFGRRMTEILKTMKPIEKRKDGTLIDYGVTVPSRKPSETTPRRRGKGVHPVLSATKNGRPNSVEPEKATKGGGAGQIEIVRKEKMSSKETKDASNRSKIAKSERPVGKEAAKTKSATRRADVVDPVKISSVKKETLTEPKVVTGRTKIVEPVKISSVKKVSAPDDSRVPSQPRSDGLERISAMKKQTHRGPHNLPYVPRFNSDQMVSKKQSSLANRESGKLGDSLAKGSVAKIGNEKKSVDTANALATSDSKKLSDGKPKDPSTSIRESSDKKETRIIFMKGSEAGSKGTTTYKPQSVAKKSRIHSCPPAPRTVDRKSEKMSPENLDKHFKETGFAPFKGTIRHQPPKSNSVNFSNISEEKQVTPKKGKSESGGGSTGFGSSTVGPAGLKSPRSFMMHTITTIDNVTTDPVAASMKKERNKCERPEKGLLYAAWLQRFKNSVDDDKML